MRPYLGPPWTDSHQIWAVDVFHHAPPIHGIQNTEMKKKQVFLFCFVFVLFFVFVCVLLLLLLLFLFCFLFCFLCHRFCTHYMDISTFQTTQSHTELKYRILVSNQDALWDMSKWAIQNWVKFKQWLGLDEWTHPNSSLIAMSCLVCILSRTPKNQKKKKNEKKKKLNKFQKWNIGLQPKKVKMWLRTIFGSIKSLYGS